MNSKESYIFKGNSGTPENGADIIMWNYDENDPEITNWTYNDGKLDPICRYAWDDIGGPGAGEMVYLDSVDSELEEEMGHPTFEEALKKYPYWDNEKNIYGVIESINEYMNFDFNSHFMRCKFYSYYAPYFINDDASGMTDDEIKDCEAFLAAVKADLEKYGYTECYVVDVLNDDDFGNVEIPEGWEVKSFDGVKFLPGDVATYVIQKAKYS